MYTALLKIFNKTYMVCKYSVYDGLLLQQIIKRLLVIKTCYTMKTSEIGIVFANYIQQMALKRDTKREGTDTNCWF